MGAAFSCDFEARQWALGVEKNKQCGRVCDAIFAIAKVVSARDVIWPAFRMDRRRRWDKKCVIKVGHLDLTKINHPRVSRGSKDYVRIIYGGR